MAVSKETIQTISNFYPGQTVRWGDRFPLGEIDKGLRLFYGHVTYNQRFIGSEEEPLTGKVTTQPVVFMERESVIDPSTGRPAIIPLTYATEIKALGGDLVQKVADRLIAAKIRSAA